MYISVIILQVTGHVDTAVGVIKLLINMSSKSILLIYIYQFTNKYVSITLFMKTHGIMPYFEGFDKIFT